jgi:hypothetical protein
MPESWNIFSIGRERGTEDQLTEMFVWLTSAVPNVGRSVVRLALGDADLDLSEVEASTQHGIAAGRLDALFTSPSLALIVESKLGSSYGNDQLRKYLDWLADEHGGRAARGLMTLTKGPAPWPPKDLAHAEALGIVATAGRWEDLHDHLSPIADQPGQDALSSPMIKRVNQGRYRVA